MKVLIIGGGASGMMAALSARKEGAEVCILERQARVGRKLLATGNGRCNLSNTKLTMKNYHGQNAVFAQTALQAFDTQKTLAFFQSLGLITTVEPSGKVYPLSDQAGSVVDVLRLALEEMGVEIRTSFEVTALKQQQKGRLSSAFQGGDPPRRCRYHLLWRHGRRQAWRHTKRL